MLAKDLNHNPVQIDNSDIVDAVSFDTGCILLPLERIRHELEEDISVTRGFLRRGTMVHRLDFSPLPHMAVAVVVDHFH